MMSGLEVSDPDDARNSTVIWSMWMMTAVSFFFICARFYTRMIIVRSVGWDDWVVLFSWVCIKLKSPLGEIPRHGTDN